MGSLLEVEKVVEVAPDLWITLGWAVHHMKCKAMAVITQSRVRLAV